MRARRIEREKVVSADAEGGLWGGSCRWLPLTLAPPVITYMPLWVQFVAYACAPPVLRDLAPSWESLRARLAATPTGSRLQREADERIQGYGPPHVNAALRLFDAPDESHVRVTFYRDSAAWCPYCQRVWLLLEEARIPYRLHTLPLNAYGDKPAWYCRLVDGGKLPAIELDGDLHVDSLPIMRLLTSITCNEVMDSDCDEARVSELLALETELQQDWFSLVFYPVEEGAPLERATASLLSVLQRVDEAIGESTPGPWLLGGEVPSFADFVFITTLERLLASVAYFKGLDVRGEGQFGHLERWLDAFDARPAYLATKGDLYSIVMALPSQNGPGYSVPAANAAQATIFGLNNAWQLEDTISAVTTAASPPPMRDLSVAEPEVDLDATADDEAARHTAAYQLITNHESVVRFAARGASDPGRPAYQAELADPNAEPNDAYCAAIDVCLRHVASALVDGAESAASTMAQDLRGVAGHPHSSGLAEGWYADRDHEGHWYYYDELSGETSYTAPTRRLDACLAYVRDRVGVPRDMPAPAAMMLRKHLNRGITVLRDDLVSSPDRWNRLSE